jgi:threonine/homoserine/homoserine lactone efflux protein
MVYLLQGLGLGFSAAASPGPFQAYLINQALQNGWRKAWPSAFAPLLSDGPVVALALLVLAAVPAWLVRGLRLAGGLLLFYLAWQAWRALQWPSPAPAPGAARQGLLQAAAANLLSPGPWLFWVTVGGPDFLAGWRTLHLAAAAFLGGFYAATVVCLLALIAFFSAANRLHPRALHIIQGFSVWLLAGLGIYQLWLGLAGTV